MKKTTFCLYSVWKWRLPAYTQYKMEGLGFTYKKSLWVWEVVLSHQKQIFFPIYTQYSSEGFSAYTQYEKYDFLRVPSMKMETFCAYSVYTWWLQPPPYCHNWKNVVPRLAFWPNIRAKNSNLITSEISWQCTFNNMLSL